MLRACGFEIERESRLYAVPFGTGHAPRGNDVRALATRLVRRAITGHDGVPHHAALARVPGD
jgi:hypothetical protein